MRGPWLVLMVMGLAAVLVFLGYLSITLVFNPPNPPGPQFAVADVKVTCVGNRAEFGFSLTNNYRLNSIANVRMLMLNGTIEVVNQTKAYGVLGLSSRAIFEGVPLVAPCPATFTARVEVVS